VVYLNLNLKLKLKNYLIILFKCKVDKTLDLLNNRNFGIMLIPHTKSFLKIIESLIYQYDRE